MFHLIFYIIQICAGCKNEYFVLFHYSLGLSVCSDWHCWSFQSSNYRVKRDTHSAEGMMDFALTHLKQFSLPWNLRQIKNGDLANSPQELKSVSCPDLCLWKSFLEPLQSARGKSHHPGPVQKQSAVAREFVIMELQRPFGSLPKYINFNLLKFWDREIILEIIQRERHCPSSLITEITDCRRRIQQSVIAINFWLC